ncbi:hypothetical protein PPSIR1_19629 [Plesiocystis pacifica SIR-1]|uniref:Uncharacterized protein n=1 Tax=Plesiocystis pacifica SIR-1 TaxID=391625 RepID=A6GAM5_9BACT|nr:hypothetical protein PPSIR1_19629 [Plesiocystis pacifica SIR-1]
MQPFVSDEGVRFRARPSERESAPAEAAGARDGSKQEPI